MTQQFSETIDIDASTLRVWKALTGPEHMRTWMGDPAMELEVAVDWRVGGAMSVRGIHHGYFENRGVVLAFEPETRLSYTHLSSVSRLPDAPESYSTLDFRLQQAGERTRLALTLTGFPTDTIYRHLAFYWSGTLSALKRYVEAAQASRCRPCDPSAMQGQSASDISTRS
jgi:uncharacterized protein YndB with AHSA1/START domain